MTRLGLRHCNGCDRDLPEVTNFYKSRRVPGRYESRCKECRREMVRRQHQAKLATAGANT